MGLVCLSVPFFWLVFKGSQKEANRLLGVPTSRQTHMYVYIYIYIYTPKVRVLAPSVKDRLPLQQAAIPDYKTLGKSTGSKPRHMFWWASSQGSIASPHTFLKTGPNGNSSPQALRVFTWEKEVEVLYVMGQNKPPGTAVFSPWFHLPGFHFEYLFLTHSHMGDKGGGGAKWASGG